jgi:DNA-binding response OmpR family regulator
MDFNLTKKEQKVFDLLLQHEVTSKSVLMTEVWKVHPDLVKKIKTRTVDMTVARLRKKIPFTIETVRGVGYRLLVG